MNRAKLLAAVGLIGLAASANANVLFFQMNPNYVGQGQRQAFIFGAANSTGTVTGTSGFNQAFDLGAQGFAVVTLNNADELGIGSIENKGFNISSSANLSGYFLSRQPFTTDMTYLIDGAKLGKDYYVAAYGGFNTSQMSVQATTDNTLVTISPKGGAAFDVTLNAGQTYLYNSADVTGSRIQANKSIAVFSGNQCTNVPGGSFACDHLVEQMPSVDLLSKTYVVAQTPATGVNGNVLRVIATADGTDVKIDGSTVATLNAGDFYEGRVAGGEQIVSNNKILVAEYLVGQSEAGGANTDPAMTIIPGADQWLKSYVFATPSGIADFPTDFISILINSSDLGSLLIDGTLANPALFAALGSTGYSFGNIDVSSKTGPFVISANNPFQLLLSGFDNYDSYFTYGGAAFSPGASPPPPPPPTDNAIPEPANWAMLIAGFGLVGGAARYRKGKKSVSFT